MSQYPALRMRRRRQAPWMRDMVTEHRLHPTDFIWPLFICEGEGEEQPISALRGVSRWSIDKLIEQVKMAKDAGIPCVALFPNTPDDKRTEDEALNPDNLICRAVRAIKEQVPGIGVMTDVALDPYTPHGHDGVLAEDGSVDNDATVAILTRQALVQAEAGADIVAPSDMMDGRIGAIRDVLEEHGHSNTAIMAYSAKYASSLYGPFREAVGAGDRLKGDKKGYQMNPSNGDEAMAEVELDISEGADFVMVKPGLLYLDVVARVSDTFDTPVFAYMTSGEYAMIEECAAAGAGDREKMLMEALTAFKRAGATGILSYHALEVARKLG